MALSIAYELFIMNKIKDKKIKAIGIIDLSKIDCAKNDNKKLHLYLSINILIHYFEEHLIINNTFFVALVEYK